MQYNPSLHKNRNFIVTLFIKKGSISSAFMKLSCKTVYCMEVMNSCLFFFDNIYYGCYGKKSNIDKAVHQLGEYVLSCRKYRRFQLEQNIINSLI